MIDEKDQLRLQASLDGELTGQETRDVAAWMGRDAEAAALAAELERTRQALKGFEAGVRLPESREFFWSKIEREIQRQERSAAASSEVSRLARLARLLVPATAMAVLAAGLFIAVRFSGSGTSQPAVAMTAQSSDNAFTYRDYDAGATLVWLSYPAENELADSDDFDTLN